MYRVAPDAVSERCHRHDNAPSVATCERCLRPICEPCLIYVGAAPFCPPCAHARRIQRLARGLGMALALGAAVVGVVLYLRSLPARFDYGARAPLVRAARDAVERERCDRRATQHLEETLLEAGDARGVIVDAAAFAAACGDWYRVHWNAYTAYRRLGDNASAVAEATRLIEHAPSDKDYRWWRGIAYEDLGKLDEAVADYRECIRLRPDVGNIPFNLANVLERQGKRCEAKEALEAFVHYHPSSADDEGVMARIARLADRCADR